MLTVFVSNNIYQRNKMMHGGEIFQLVCYIFSYFFTCNTYLFIPQKNHNKNGHKKLINYQTA